MGAAAAESNRSLPPRPRGAASAIAESRSGTRRLGARRSPDLPEPGAGECGRPWGPGRRWALPAGSGLPGRWSPQEGGTGVSGCSRARTRDDLDWPGRGGAPSPSFSSSGTIVYKDTASLPTPGRDHRVLTIPPGRRGGGRQVGDSRWVLLAVTPARSSLRRRQPWVSRNDGEVGEQFRGEGNQAGAVGGWLRHHPPDDAPRCQSAAVPAPG